MQKLIVASGVVILLAAGGLFYRHVMSDDMQLQRLGFTTEATARLLSEHPVLAQQLIEDRRSSEHIMEFLNAQMFSYPLYDAYVAFAQANPTLEAEEVVHTVTFVNHVFFPTLAQVGYDKDTLELWSQSERLNQLKAEADLFSLNQLLNFAKETGEDLYTLYHFMDYERRFPHLRIEEIIDNVNFYQTVLLPTLKEKGYSSADIEKLYEGLELETLKLLMETTLQPQHVLDLMAVSSFNPDYFETYAEILNESLDRNATYVVQLAKHPNVKGHFYEEIVATPHLESLLVLVNRNFRLGDGYRPTDFFQVNVPITEFSLTNTNYLRREAAAATEALFASALEVGHELMLRDGFISFETQRRLYLEGEGEDVLSSVPRPGHSEHQTGLAITLTLASLNEELVSEFAQTEAGEWVAENAHRFGFIIRYPEGRESETGMMHRPFHLRFVGVEAATEIYENNWILEDYILSHALLENSALEGTSEERTEDEINASEEVQQEESTSLEEGMDSEITLSEQESELESTEEPNSETQEEEGISELEQEAVSPDFSERGIEE